MVQPSYQCLQPATVAEHIPSLYFFLSLPYFPSLFCCITSVHSYAKLGTAALAQRLATLLDATSVVWSAEERKKSAFRVSNLRRLKRSTAVQVSKKEGYLHCFGAEAGAGADNALRDPNFRLREEVPRDRTPSITVRLTFICK